MKEDISKAIKIARVHRGLTAAQLAEMAGVKPSQVSILENGRKNFTIDLLIKVLEVLELKISI